MGIKNAGKNAAVGGATGAIGGAPAGPWGAAIGGAAGAVGGFLQGLFQDDPETARNILGQVQLRDEQAQGPPQIFSQQYQPTGGGSPAEPRDPFAQNKNANMEEVLRRLQARYGGGR